MTKVANLKLPDPPPPLQIGLIAPADAMEPYLGALGANPEMRLAAQGGLPQSAVTPPVAWFDDLRVLIAQGPIDAVILAVSPRLGSELGTVAAERGRHVWRPPPLARNFAEAVEIVRRISGSDIVYRIGSWWEHIREAAGVAERRDEAARPVLSDLMVNAAGPGLDSWRASLADAGGGVLLTDAYDMLEALVAMRGLPESVFAATGKCRSKAVPSPRETEDFAEALLRYADGGTARVSARWDVLPYGESTSHHAATTSQHVSRDRIAALGGDGATLAETPLPANFLEAEMQRFARDVRSRSGREHLDAMLARHLAVSAIAEATYLSSRTGQPESPRRLYEAQKCEELIP